MNRLSSAFHVALTCLCLCRVSRTPTSAGGDLSEAQASPVKADDALFAAELQTASVASAPSIDTASATETPAFHLSEVKVSRRQAATTRLAWGLVAFLTVALLVMYLSDHTGHASLQASTDPHHLLWSEMFSPAHPTTIIAGDSSFCALAGVSASQHRSGQLSQPELPGGHSSKRLQPSEGGCAHS